MKVAIKGPSKSQTNVIDHFDGLCTVEYVALTPGLYKISIYFGDNEEQISGICCFLILVFFFAFKFPVFIVLSVVVQSDLLNAVGSPFTVLVDYVYDPSEVMITGYTDGHVRADVPVSLLVDATRTAMEPISARLPVGFQQPFVEEIKPRVYRVTFTPSAKAGEILPLEVFYGGQLLHGR